MNSKQIKQAELAMAQDYWHQVMNLGQRMEVMSAVEYVKESINKRYNRILAHVFATNKEAVIAHQKDLMAQINK